MRDLDIPDLAEVVVVTSPHAHAVVRGIDIERAEAVPGVIAIVTAADICADRIASLRPSAESSLLVSTARFIGDNIAAVVAEDEATARCAAALVSVDYEPLLAEASLFDSATLDTGIAECLAQNGASTFTCLIARTAFGEEGCAIASWRDDALTIVTDDMPTAEEQMMLCEHALPGLSQMQVDWHATTPHLPTRSGMAGSAVALAVMLSRSVRRPVRVRAWREGRAAQSITARSSVDHDGHIAAIDVAVKVDTGAYPAAYPRKSFREPDACLAPGVIRTVIQTVASNSPTPAVIDRGGIEISFAVQQAMDAAARGRDMDPLSFRLLNTNSVPISSALREAARTFGWDAKWQGWAVRKTGRRLSGAGTALVGTHPADQRREAAVAAFADLDVDSELGTVSVGRLTVALICCGSGSTPTRLALDAGICRGVAAALIDEMSMNSRTEFRAAKFASRPCTVLDMPETDQLFFQRGPGADVKFTDIAGLAAAAVVGAIANAVCHATGTAPVMLPISHESLRLLPAGGHHRAPRRSGLDV